MPRIFMLRGRLRRLRDLSQSIGARHDVALADLIVPYRLDIVVRRRMIDQIVTNQDSSPHSDDELLDWAQESGYSTWYSQVEVMRFRRKIIRDPAAQRATLLQRIRGLERLVASMQASDSALTKRLVLDWHLRSAVSESGVIDAFAVAPADGCHRIAYLSLLGVKSLDARQHRLRICIGQTIRDNTRLLVGCGGFSQESTLQTLAGEHAGFAAVLGGADDGARADEFSRWIGNMHRRGEQ